MAAREAEAARIARGDARDPRLADLRAAVDRLRRELGDYQAALADREVAERQLAALDTMIGAGAADEAALRDALLMIAAAVGSVSALSPAVGRLREAVEPFGVARERGPFHVVSDWGRVPAGRPASF